MSEIWVPAFGYSGLYEVSNHGNVRSLGRETEFAGRWGITKTRFQAIDMKSYRHRSGYVQIALRKDGEGKKFLVHRLVMASFVGESHLQVNHIDGDKWNNRLENLEYCTSSENLLHASNVLGTRRGSAMKSKLKEEDIPKIRADKRILKEIAADYNVTLQAIHLVKAGKNWGWIE